jgi:hypothetical protein
MLGLKMPAFVLWTECEMSVLFRYLFIPFCFSLHLFAANVQKVPHTSLCRLILVFFFSISFSYVLFYYCRLLFFPLRCLHWSLLHTHTHTLSVRKHSPFHTFFLCLLFAVVSLPPLCVYIYSSVFACFSFFISLYPLMPSLVLVAFFTYRFSSSRIYTVRITRIKWKSRVRIPPFLSYVM